MKFSELPIGLSVDQIMSKLNLESGQQLLFACGAKIGQFTSKETGVFVFTDSAIYRLDGETFEIRKKQQKENFLSIRIEMVFSYLFFTDEIWAIHGLDRARRKALEEICATAYPNLSKKPFRISYKDKVPAMECYPNLSTKQAAISNTDAQNVVTSGRTQSTSNPYGDIVVTAKFGMLKKVSLHSKGFISGMGSRPEKLLAISGQADISKKSGLGRAVGAVASAGWNLGLNNKRGDIYITIVTDVKTHTIHIDMKNQNFSQNPVEEMQKLITTAELLIKQNR